MVSPVPARLVALVLITVQELDAVARDWTKPPPDAVFGLRVPVEYASIHAAVSPPFVFVLVHPDSMSSPATGRRSLHLCMIPDRARSLSRPLICPHQLTSEDSYQIAVMGVQGLRVEIVSDAPPPPDEPP
jgi:hypothetical protein